jgi:hypothetical protein
MPSRFISATSAAPVVEAVEVVGLLAALLRRDVGIGEGIEAGLGGELDRAQAEPVEGAQHVEVAFVVPAGLVAEEHRHAAALDHAARLGGGGDDRHPVGVLLGMAVRRLDQAQEDLGACSCSSSRRRCRDCRRCS